MTVAHANGEATLSIPLTGDLEALLAIKEMKEITVHGKPLLVNASEVERYLNDEESAITTEEELGQLLERQLSPEDVQKLFNQQLRKKIVGQQFTVTEVGEMSPAQIEDLVLLVPKVKLDVKIVENALSSIATDDLENYVTFLPPETEEQKLNPIKCITGSTLREFLNVMQDEDGGLDMNSQISIYLKLLTSLPDSDPTKKLGLMQLRSLMVYGDIVSNKDLRIAVTDLVTQKEI